MLSQCVTASKTSEAVKQGQSVHHVVQSTLPAPSTSSGEEGKASGGRFIRFRDVQARSGRHNRVLALPFTALNDTNQYGYYDPQSNSTVIVVFRELSHKRGEIARYHKFSLSAIGKYKFMHRSPKTGRERDVGAEGGHTLMEEYGGAALRSEAVGGGRDGGFRGAERQRSDGDWRNNIELRCWHCVDTLKDPDTVMSCPTRYDGIRNTFQMKGYFCGVSCAAAWGLRHGDMHTKNNCISYLRMIIKQAFKEQHGMQPGDKFRASVHGELKITPAPAREVLEEFGGCVSREEFRAYCERGNEWPGEDNKKEIICSLDKPNYIPVPFGVFIEDLATHPMNLVTSEIRVRRSITTPYTDKQTAIQDSTRNGKSVLKAARLLSASVPPPSSSSLSTTTAPSPVTKAEGEGEVKSEGKGEVKVEAEGEVKGGGEGSTSNTPPSSPSPLLIAPDAPIMTTPPLPSPPPPPLDLAASGRKQSTGSMLLSPPHPPAALQATPSQSFALRRALEMSGAFKRKSTKRKG